MQFVTEITFLSQFELLRCNVCWIEISIQKMETFHSNIWLLLPIPTSPYLNFQSAYQESESIRTGQEWDELNIFYLKLIKRINQILAVVNSFSLIHFQLSITNRVFTSVNVIDWSNLCSTNLIDCQAKTKDPTNVNWVLYLNRCCTILSSSLVCQGQRTI